MASNNFSNGEQQDSSSVPFQKTVLAPNTVTEQVVPLLEERLMVNLIRRKTGEVVVRKEIETHLLQVQVPIRREKLIVEQVSPEYKLLAKVDLGQVTNADKAINSVLTDLGIAHIEQNSGQKSHSLSLDQGSQTIICGQTSSPQTASDVLDMIAHMPSHNCENIKIEIVLKDSTHKDTYQALFNRNFDV